MKKANREVVREYTDEKTGAKMVVYKAEAKVRDKATKKVTIVATGEYHEPVTLQDGIKFDGRATVEKVWKAERYTNYLDNLRNATTESKRALTSQLLAALATGDANRAVELAQKLGFDLKKGLSAILASAKTEVPPEPNLDYIELDSEETDETDDETSDIEDSE